MCRPGRQGWAHDRERARATRGRGSLRTVLVALTANLLIAVAKSVAAAISGSAAMVAEAAHSWADTGNEVFLVVGARRADKPEAESHPVGYGREGYVWSMFAAFGLFTVGAAVSVWHGVQALLEPAALAEALQSKYVQYQTGDVFARILIFRAVGLRGWSAT